MPRKSRKKQALDAVRLAQAGRLLAPVEALDAVITGSWGLYTVAFLTDAGRAWREEHLPKGDEITEWCGQVVVEGGDRCRAIVAGMDRDGLQVEVNGVNMKGFGKTG